MTIVAAICHYIAVYFAMYNSPFVCESRVAGRRGAADRCQTGVGTAAGAGTALDRVPGQSTSARCAWG